MLESVQNTMTLPTSPLACCYTTSKTCIWNVSRGAVHRSWQTRTALLAWSALSFCFSSFRSMPLTLSMFSLRTKRCSRSLRPTIARKKVSGRLREVLKKKLSVFFGAGTARSAAWPPLNCACVSQLFEQLINTTLCPAFLRKFVCKPLCCVPLQIQTFYQNLALVANTAVTFALTNFRCHKLIAKVNK